MRKIVVLDLETTGVNVSEDKIVQIGVRKMNPDFTEKEELKKYLINPQRPIPKEAIEAHGITDEMVANEPVFVKRALGIYNYLDGCDLVGYNIKNFDVPLLSEEFARCSITWPAPEVRILDAYVIFREKERRDLTAAYKFYCGKVLEGAHDAGNDLLATEEIMEQQLKHYTDLTGKTIDELHAFCEGDTPRLDLAGKIVLKDGIAIYSFGKDKDKSVKEFPGFGHWMLDPKNSFSKNTRDVVLALTGPAPEKKSWKR